MARGLCDKCAEKWSYGHKCFSTVQLNVVQELCDLFLKETEVMGCTPDNISVGEVDHLYACISEAAVVGVESSMSDSGVTFRAKIY
jgi:hypothetical protein